MDEENKSEQEKFLSDLEVDEKKDPFEQPITEVEEPEKEESAEETEQKAKNRRERRLLKQNQELREETIAATAKLQALSEAKRFVEDAGNDPLKEVEAIFGTDTPEKKAATDILKKALSGMSESAVQKALEKIEEQRESESRAVAEAEKSLDEMMEEVEEEFNVDLSEPATRKGFLTLLEKISPKDRDGNIIEYADASTVYEIYESQKTKSASKAKDLASRSMVRSGASQPSKLEEDANLRFLRDNGII